MTLPMANRDLQRLGIKFGHFESLGGCFGDLLGMTFPTQLYGDYFINHEIRIPSLTNQYFMESRSCFFRGSGEFTFSLLYDASWH